MKKQLFLLGLPGFLTLNSFAQTSATVSVGANYADQKWYSFQNGIQATQPKDNWDLAFEVTGYSSAILANTQKSNFALYKAPYKIADYATLDTAGISNWTVLYNSDTTWTIGALNRGANPSDPFDLGWGLYDLNTHFVTGDSCYVVKLSATSYKKIKLINLANGIYNFEYANINGTSSQTVALDKSNYTGKNFVYFDMTGNAAIDREPASSTWDLTFVKYTAFIPVPYPVVGVLSNKGVTVAQADNVAASYSTWASLPFYSNISTVGSDWKGFDLTNNVWNIVSDTCYFVHDKSGNIWKMAFTAFGGSTNGNIVFNQQKISVTGIATNNQVVSNVAVYPNPSAGDIANLLFSSEASVGEMSVSITDLNGRVLSSEIIHVEAGLTRHALDTKALSSGLYLVQLSAGSSVTTQKLVKH